MKTTIQLSDDVRRRIKVLASQRDLSYEEALNDLLNVFERVLPFKNERDFAKWFEENLEVFGLAKIVEKRSRGFPDYICVDKSGKEKGIELELFAEDFVRHMHNPSKADLIICVYSTKDEILGVPTASLIDATSDLSGIIKRENKNKYTTVSIPVSLGKSIEELIDGTGFTSVGDFAVFVLREILTEKRQGMANDEARKRVRERLKALGYIED